MSALGQKQISCAALADNVHNDEILDNVAKRMRRQPTPFH